MKRLNVDAAHSTKTAGGGPGNYGPRVTPAKTVWSENSYDEVEGPGAGRGIVWDHNRETKDLLFFGMKKEFIKSIRLADNQNYCWMTSSRCAVVSWRRRRRDVLRSPRARVLTAALGNRRRNAMFFQISMKAARQMHSGDACGEMPAHVQAYLQLHYVH